MAFPFVGDEDFEDGTVPFDATTDTGGALSIAHYSELARTPGIAMPYRGAYCMKVDVGSVSTQSFYRDDTIFDISAAASLFVRFKLFLSDDLTMANTDEFNILELNATPEVAVAINFTTANGFRIGIGETGGTAFLPISLGVWNTVELSITLDDGGSNDGTIDGWLNGSAFAQVASLDQAAVTLGQIGVMAIDAGTTKGTVLIDDIKTDDARLGADDVRDRFSTTRHMTKSGHLFVGPGTLENITLLSGSAADCHIFVYDTDVADTTLEPKVILHNTAASEVVDPAGVPVEGFKRGCYIALSGTADADGPMAIGKFCKTPAYGSEGAIRGYALRRN